MTKGLLTFLIMSLMTTYMIKKNSVSEIPTISQTIKVLSKFFELDAAAIEIL